MPTQVQAPDTPPGLQHKSATTEPIVTTDDRTGEVTAVVSVTNVVDEVGDIILPGAYSATLAKRKPKGVWSHSWKDWVARTEEIREFAPGDPQLKSLLDEAGAVLPANAGALVVRCKFNMDDPDSYKAYQKVKFFSETNECQWSIGYSVPPKMGVRDAKGIRRISGLELFEYSPVLFGAATQSTSLSVKSLDPIEWPDREQKDAETVQETAEDFAWDDYDPSTPDPSADELDAVEDVARGVADEDDDNDAPGDAAGEDTGDTEPGAAEVEAPGGEENDVPPEVEGGPPEDGAPGAEDAADEGTEVKRKFTPGQRDKAASAGAAMPDGSFPIKTEQDLRNAIQAVGRAKDQGAAKAHIIKRARALGLTNLLPDGWVTSTKSEDPAEILAELEARLATIEAKYDTSPVGKPGGKQNWVDKAGGLPPFVRAVAHALIRAGHSQSQAIQLAVGVIRRWAAGGGDVSEKTRAKAAATIARWDAMKGSKDVGDELETPTGDTEENQAEPVAEEAASGEPEALLTKWDPLAEVGPQAACLPSRTGASFAVESKDLPQLSGTYEERREMVRMALCDLLTPEDYTAGPGADVPSKGWVSVDGTWDDQVVATVYGGGSDEKATWRVPYSLEPGTDGASMVVLGQPQPVRLTLAVENTSPADTEDSYDLPSVLLDGMDTAMTGAKLLAAVPQTKAGRVLSGNNAGRIASAVESLIAVLMSAGVDIKLPKAPKTQVPEGTPDGPEDGSVPAASSGKPGETKDSGEGPESFDLDDLLADAARLRVLALRS